MKRFARFSGAALLAVALLGTQAAMAQETGVTGELERAASTTPQEKLDYAVDANEEMRSAIKSISKLVEVARRENNVETLQCLNTRLTAMRALLQVSEGAEVALNETLAAGEAERADHEFRKVAVARTKTRQLLAEAEQCTQEGGLTRGDGTVVTVEGELSGDDSDMDAVPFDPFDLGIDPPEASPFL